jgi:hypothetical protein
LVLGVGYKAQLTARKLYTQTSPIHAQAGAALCDAVIWSKNAALSPKGGAFLPNRRRLEIITCKLQLLA